MARKKPTPVREPTIREKHAAARNAKKAAGTAAQLTSFAETVLVTADSLGIKKEPLEHFWLAPDQRNVLRSASRVSKILKAKLKAGETAFSIAEVVNMTVALAEASAEGDAQKQLAALLVAKHLVERLQEGMGSVAEPEPRKVRKSKTKADLKTIYQFKVTLLEIKPPIWRRIQISDCTLAGLHEYIQTAFGWENYHLHQFEIDGVQYSQPSPDGDDMGMEFEDEADFLISQFIPKSAQKSRWSYEYDFGDSWRHQVVFEGSPPHDPKAKYPLCLEGKRACPPEDCGGPWGYADFLDAISNKKHKQHEEMLEWIGGDFDPEAFDVATTSEDMKMGLPE